MDDLLKQVIEIADITIKKYDTGQQAKVKSTDGKTYTVYEKKQDGTTSAAWAALDKLAIGSTAQFCYVEKPGEYQGKAYTSRIVRIINEDIGNGMKNAMANMAPSQQAFDKTGPGTIVKDDKFWEQQAYEKCCSLWIASDLAHNNDIQGVLGYLKNDKYWLLFQAIKADGKKRFFEFSPAAKAESEPLPEELPIIQVQDINVDDIPF